LPTTDRQCNKRSCFVYNVRALATAWLDKEIRFSLRGIVSGKLLLLNGNAIDQLFEAAVFDTS